MSIAVILPAAGAGSRFHDAADPDAPRSKIEIELAGKAVFMRAIDLFLQHEDVVQIILAVHPERIDAFNRRWGDALRFHDVQVVAGGTAERWETVAKALAHVSDECTYAAVHDAARPLTSQAVINRVFETAKRYNAAVPGVAVSNTLKRVEPLEEDRVAGAPGPSDEVIDAILGGAGKPSTGPVQRVVETVDRNALVQVQTPQMFDVLLLRRAYAQITEGDFDAAGVTDDARLVEALGEPVAVVEGDPFNLKITRPSDLELAEAILRQREAKKAADIGKKRLFDDDDDE